MLQFGHKQTVELDLNCLVVYQATINRHFSTPQVYYHRPVSRRPSVRNVGL